MFNLYVDNYNKIKCCPFSVLLWVLAVLSCLHPTISGSTKNNNNLFKVSSKDRNESNINENNYTIHNEKEIEHNYPSSMWQALVQEQIEYIKETFYIIFNTIFDISQRNNKRTTNNDAKNITEYYDTKHENSIDNNLKEYDIEKPYKLGMPKNIQSYQNGNESSKINGINNYKNNDTPKEKQKNEEKLKNDDSKKVTYGEPNQKSNETENKTGKQNPRRKNEDKKLRKSTEIPNTNLISNINKKSDSNINIRTLRQKLLDYLLDYIVTVEFNNVIDTELNETITLEDRLKNYYINHLHDAENEEFNFDQKNHSSTDGVHVAEDNNISNDVSTSKNKNSRTYKDADQGKHINMEKNNSTTDKANTKTSVGITNDKEKFGRSNENVIKVNGDKSHTTDSENTESIKNSKSKDNKLITNKNNINNNILKKDNNETSAININNDIIGNKLKQDKDDNELNNHELVEENVIKEPKNYGDEEENIKEENYSIESERNDGMEVKKPEANNFTNKSKELSTENEPNDKNKTKTGNTRKNNDFKTPWYHKFMKDNCLKDNIKHKKYETILNDKKHNYNDIGDEQSEIGEKEPLKNMDKSFEYCKDNPEHFNKEENTKGLIEILTGKKKGTTLNVNKKHVEIKENHLEKENCDKSINNNEDRDGNSLKLKLLLFL